MTSPTHYGVISGILSDPRAIEPALAVLRHHGIDGIIAAGDLSPNSSTEKNAQDKTAYILDQLGKSGIDTYIIPGSREKLNIFQPVLNHFTDRYQNIISGLEEQVIEKEGHTLILLPGSPAKMGGHYRLGGPFEGYREEDPPTGFYYTMDNDVIISKDDPDFQKLRENGEIKGILHYTNPEDLLKWVTDPDNSIIVSNEPRRFYDRNTCVDASNYCKVNEYHEVYEVTFTSGKEGSIVATTPISSAIRSGSTSGLFQKSFGIEKVNRCYALKKGSMFNATKADEFARLGIDVSCIHDNEGSDVLRDIYEEIGVSKAISAHFRGGAHRPHTIDETPLKPDCAQHKLF